MREPHTQFPDGDSGATGRRLSIFKVMKEKLDRRGTFGFQASAGPEKKQGAYYNLERR